MLGPCCCCWPLSSPCPCTFAGCCMECPKEGGSREQPHHEPPIPVLRATGTHPSPLCSSSLALLVAPASHLSQSGGVSALVSLRQGHLLPPPPAVPHFGVPAALGSPGLKVTDTATHPAGLCRLSWLSAGQDDMSPERGECPQGQRADRAMRCPNCVTPL